MSKPQDSTVVALDPEERIRLAQSPTALSRGLRHVRRRPIGFTETPTAERILSTLALAQAYGRMVCIYGGPGVGKTESIKRFLSQYENAWAATISPVCSAVVPALEEIAEAIGIHEPTGGARRISKQICARVRGLGGLVIVDEAQHLGMAAIESLRAIHDATGVGLALMGNHTVYSRLTGRTRSADFAQLFSRLGMRLYVPQPTSEDVRAIAGHWNVAADALEVLDLIAEKPGALRAIVNVLELADEGKRISADHVRTACDRLGMAI